MHKRISVISIGLLIGLLGITGGCGPGSGGSGGTLVALGFNVQGRTDVSRNEPVVVEFSSMVNPTSVSVVGFHIRDDEGEIFPGRVVVDGNRVTFFPTVFDGVDGQGVDQSVNQYNPPNFPPENAVGFEPSTLYTLEVLGDSVLGPLTVAGRPLVRSFFGTFRTGDEFLPEPDPTPPMLAEPPVFNQTPVNNACAPDSIFGDPTEGCPPGDPDVVPVPSFHPASLTVQFRFSEPMDPTRIDSFNTLTMTNLSTGQQIFGEVVPAGDLQSFTFRPPSTLGDDPTTSDPFQFEIVLSNELTDLAGNRLVGNPDVDGNRGELAEPLIFRFTTVDAPGEPGFVFFVEEFDDQLNRGNVTDPGVWTGDGVLEGLPVRFREVEVEIMNASNIALPRPLTAAGSRTQLLVDSSVINSTGFGVPESIIGASWGPQSNFVASGLYPLVTLTMGHTNARDFTGGLGLNFGANFSGFLESPTVVFQGAYELSSGQGVRFVDWPTFRTDFEYNGRSNMVFEIDVAPGGDTFQLFINEVSACTPKNRVFGESRAAEAGGNSNTGCGSGDDAIYQQRFQISRKASFAMSRDLDTGSDDPDYETLVVVVDEERLGATFELEFFGKLGSGFPPRPDDATVIGGFEQVDMIDGFRFFSFSFDLSADPFTGIVPLVESLSVGFRTN